MDRRLFVLGVLGSAGALVPFAAHADAGPMTPSGDGPGATSQIRAEPHAEASTTAAWQNPDAPDAAAEPVQYYGYRLVRVRRCFVGPYGGVRCRWVLVRRPVRRVYRRRFYY